jgi:hypothetical protein
MRRFILSAALVASSLLGLAGMADAKGFDNQPRRTVVERHETRRPIDRGHGPVINRGGFDGHYRDFNHRPDRRFERHDVRAGYSWQAGDWQWNGAEWIWVPGSYVRVIV